MMPNYADEHSLPLAHGSKAVKKCWTGTNHYIPFFFKFLLLLSISSQKCPCTLMWVLWMCAHAYNVSAHTRKIKTKFEIFLKNKSNSLLWTSYPSLSWCHLDICGFSVMPVRTQACSVAGLSGCWEKHTSAGVGVTCFSYYTSLALLHLL